MKSSFRHAVRTLLISASLLSTANAAHAEVNEHWVGLAHQSLMAALQERYPGVQHWSVKPLMAKFQRPKSVPGSEAVKTQVVRLGVRSAVQLEWGAQRRMRSTLWFAVTGEQALPTAVASIQALAPLEPSLLIAARVNAVAIGCTPIDSADEVSGHRAKRRLRAGDAICKEAIEARPPVARGETVVVRSIAGPVTLLTTGIAQQDAQLGQSLRVRNVSSGDVFVAAVVDSGEVAVHE